MIYRVNPRVGTFLRWIGLGRASKDLAYMLIGPTGLV